MEVISLKGQELKYTIRRSRRFRGRKIIVSYNKIEIIASKWVSKRALKSFIDSEKIWVFNKWQEMQLRIDSRRLQPKKLADGEKLFYRGQHVPISIIMGDEIAPIIHFEAGFHITLPKLTPDDKVESIAKKLLKAYLEKEFREEAEQIIAKFAPLLDVTPSGYVVKRQKSLWGSCSVAKNLNLNFNLIFVPYEAMEYVVVHELCHLQHMNHSRDFWQLVESVLPDYKARQKLLKEYNLQRVRYDF